MDTLTPTTWWVMTGLLVATELAVGSFYLLMLAIGTAAGALAGHLGVAPAGQLAVAGIVGVAAVVLLRRIRPPGVGRRPSKTDRNVHLDIGQPVEVEKWDEAGRTTLHWRGAAWEASWAGDGPAAPGRHVIHAVDGNLLLLVR